MRVLLRPRGSEWWIQSQLSSEWPARFLVHCSEALLTKVEHSSSRVYLSPLKLKSR